MPIFETLNETTNKEKNIPKKDNILIIYVILVAIFMGIFIASILVFYYRQQNTNVIQSGIYIKDINVSGLTKEQAIELVNSDLKKQMNDHLELTYKNHNYYVEVEQIEAKFDVEASVNFAFDVAKTGNMMEDISTYISVLMNNTRSMNCNKY